MPDRTDYLANDDQVGSYIYFLKLAHQLGLIELPEGRIEGVLYRWVKKKVPTKMKPLSRDPYLSVDKRIDTTYEMAIADIKEYHHGEVPKRYQEFLDHLKAKGNTFVQQEYVRRNAKEIARIGESLPFEIAEMVNDPRIYRSASKINCNGCAFLGPCILKWTGGDFQTMLDDEYKPRVNRYPIEEAF